MHSEPGAHHAGGTFLTFGAHTDTDTFKNCGLKVEQCVSK